MFNMIIYGSLLILFVILIRPLTIKQLPKDVFIMLWLIAIIRLMIPFTMPEVIQLSPPPQVNTITETAGIQLPQVMNNAFEIIPSVPNTETVIPKQTISAETIIAIVWIAGSIITFAAFYIPHLVNLKRYSPAMPIDNEYIADWKSQHQLIRKYRILQSDEISAPFTYGIIRPIIILPEAMLNSDYNVIDYVLTHEFLHIKYFDIVKKWLMLITLSVHWFNPLVWIMNRMINSDIEIACDEKVIKSKGITNRAYYAAILVELAAVRPRYLIMANNFNKNIIKTRIKLIMKTTKTTFRQIVLCLLILSFTLVINLTSFAEADIIPIPNIGKPDKTADVTDPYEKIDVRYGETPDILLLDVEWYTYETYYEDIWEPLIKEYADKELNDYKEFWYYNYGGHIIYTNDPVEAAEKTALGIKYKKIIMARTINGRSCKYMDFPIYDTVINNGKENFEQDMAGLYDENGYYKFRVPYQSEIGFGYSTKNGELCVKLVTFLEDDYYIISQDEYQAGVKKNFHAFVQKLYDDGDISRESYDYYMFSEEFNAPRDYYISMFFR